MTAEMQILSPRAICGDYPLTEPRVEAYNETGLDETIWLSGRDVADWGIAMQQASALDVITPGDRHSQPRYVSDSSSTVADTEYEVLLIACGAPDFGGVLPCLGMIPW